MAKHILKTATELSTGYLVRGWNSKQVTLPAGTEVDLIRLAFTLRLKGKHSVDCWLWQITHRDGGQVYRSSRLVPKAETCVINSQGQIGTLAGARGKLARVVDSEGVETEIALTDLEVSNGGGN